MRKKHFLVATLLIVSSVYASDRIKKIIKDTKVTVSGVLDTSTVPYRLLINSGYQNQEIVFLRKIKSHEAITYADTEVTVSGRVDLFQDKQYIISVESIRTASPEELEPFKKGF